jgi:histidinol-phosphate phosphatase family protein
MTKPFPPQPRKWALFLDRDGVINERIPDVYIQRPEDFTFTAGTKEALSDLAHIFDPVILVTNQQGIGKGLMTEEELQQLHLYMQQEIEQAGGRLDAIFYCPHRADENHPDRKPNIGMALKAKKQFPAIEFQRSIMVGDSQSDILFGKTAGMLTIFIAPAMTSPPNSADFCFRDLAAFADWIKLHEKSLLL